MTSVIVWVMVSTMNGFLTFYPPEYSNETSCRNASSLLMSNSYIENSLTVTCVPLLVGDDFKLEVVNPTELIEGDIILRNGRYYTFIEISAGSGDSKDSTITVRARGFAKESNDRSTKIILDSDDTIARIR